MAITTAGAPRLGTWVMVGAGPLLLTNMLIPELIARWRGAGLLYLSRSQLWAQRIASILVLVAACLVLALVGAAIMGRT
jgi:hypothetical protein